MKNNAWEQITAVQRDISQMTAILPLLSPPVDLEQQAPGSCWEERTTKLFHQQPGDFHGKL